VADVKSRFGVAPVIARCLRSVSEIGECAEKLQAAGVEGDRELFQEEAAE
jgi:hypothetical protein